MNDRSRESQEHVEDLDVPDQASAEVKGGLPPYNPKEVRGIKADQTDISAASRAKWELSELDA